jgi:hypothetical protein
MKTIEIKQKLVEEALDQLKAAQQDSYVQSTQNVIDELELALRQPPVISQREQLITFIEWKNKKDNNWLKHIDTKEVDDFLKSN